MHPVLAAYVGAVSLIGLVSADATRLLLERGRAETADHSRRVAAAAKRLAQRWKEDGSSAEIAGWLHDISAVVPGDHRLHVAETLGLEVLAEERLAPVLIHRKLSAAIAQEVFGTTDRSVLSAIGCHTTLKANSSALGKTVFVVGNGSFNAKRASHRQKWRCKMKCPVCGTTMYRSMGGLDICPKCRHGSPSAAREKERQAAPIIPHYWKPPTPALAGATLTVDNRVFVLGLDKLYRDAMKGFEEQTLLACAESVAAALKVGPAIVPVEGYYTESPALTKYFLLMRALQEEVEARETVVRYDPGFQLLWEVTNSSLYGRPQRKGKLLPVSRDSFSQALIDTRPAWNIDSLVKAAYAAALGYDDFSLVGLAARTQDAVVLAATRESVVLYAELVAFGIHEEPQFEYEWRVDQVLATAANRFVEAFNRFVPNALPRAEAASAEEYYKAYTDNAIIGRCVRVGQSEDGSRHYHWAIVMRLLSPYEFELGVDEFWSERVWTTETYRREQRSPIHMRFFGANGVPEDEEEWQ